MKHWRETNLASSEISSSFHCYFVILRLVEETLLEETLPSFQGN